jgi:hypothetical protein
MKIGNLIRVKALAVVGMAATSLSLWCKRGRGGREVADLPNLACFTSNGTDRRYYRVKWGNNREWKLLIATESIHEALASAEG